MWQSGIRPPAGADRHAVLSTFSYPRSRDNLMVAPYDSSSVPEQLFIRTTVSLPVPVAAPPHRDSGSAWQPEVQLPVVSRLLVLNHPPTTALAVKAELATALRLRLPVALAVAAASAVTAVPLSR